MNGLKQSLWWRNTEEPGHHRGWWNGMCAGGGAWVACGLKQGSSLFPSLPFQASSSSTTATHRPAGSSTRRHSYLHTDAVSPTSYISNSEQRKNSDSQHWRPILAPKARIQAL